MDWRRYVRAHLPPLAASAERESEIVEELAIQFESTYDKARANGADEQEAIARALAEVSDWQALARTLGQIERPHPPQPAVGVCSGGIMTGLTQDLRYALRALRTWPAFPAAVLLLGVSIAALVTVAATAGAWLRPLPFREPERLAIIWGTNHAIGQVRDVVSGPTFTDWQKQATAFEALSAFASGDLTMKLGDRAEVIGTLMVTPEFFDVMGVTPALGRAFQAGDAGSPRVLISDAFWRSRLGADPHVIGSTLSRFGLPHEIIGVLPPAFRLLSAPDAVTLLDPRQLEGESRTFYYYWAMGRLRPDVGVADAQRDLDVLMARLAVEYPVMKGWTATVEPLESTLQEPVRASVGILGWIVALVFLIGTGNSANLVLSRAMARRREIAIRSAVGASMGRLRRQWLLEGQLLSFAAVAAGVALALGAIRAIALVAPRSAAIAGSAATIDLPAPELAAWLTPGLGLIGGLIGVALGVLPWRMARTGDLRSETSAGVRMTSGRKWLLATQSAVATILTAVSGLLLMLVLHLAATSPGFDGSTTTVYAIGALHDLDAAARARYYARLVETVTAAPGVTGAALNDYVPLTNEDDYEGLEIPGRPRDGMGTPREEWRRVSAGYFETLGVPLLRGRTFSTADDERAPSVVIVNAAMAAKYWPGTNPVGTRIRITSRTYGWSEIVGVVGDIREAGLDRPPKPMMFVPYHRDPRPVMGLFVNTTHQSEMMMAAIRRAIWSVDPARPILDARPMRGIVSDSYAVQRSVLWVSAGLAALALLLTASGTYAIVALVTSSRKREIGIRIALGAGPGDVVLSVLSSPCTLAAAGIVVGLASAIVLAEMIQARLTAAAGLDVPIAATAAMVVALIVVAACTLPARRAMRVDPAAILKAE